MSIIISRYTRSCIYIRKIPLERGFGAGDTKSLPGDKKEVKNMELKEYKSTQPQPQPQPNQSETTAPAPKGVILLFGRGTVVYDQGRYSLIVLTPFQPHPVHQPEEWLHFVEALLRAFLISRAPQIIIAVEKTQIPAILALIGRLRTDKKVRPARVEVKDGKFVYFPD